MLLCARNSPRSLPTTATPHRFTIVHTWNPNTATLFVVLLNFLSGLLFWRARSVPVRLVAAALVTAVLQYLSFFCLSGFGWGWPDPSGRQITLLLLGGGVSVAFTTLVFGVISLRRISFLPAVVAFLVLQPIFLLDSEHHLALLLIASGLAILTVGFLAS